MAPASPRNKRSTSSGSTSMLSQLGTASDSVIAKRLGIDRKQVENLRNKLGIPAFAKPKPGIRRAAHGRKTFTPPDGLIRLLGSATDSSLAEQFSLTTSDVRRLRSELGIPSFQQQTFESFPSEAIDLLGVLYDSQVAEMFGLTMRVVRARRLDLGIPAKGKVSSAPSDRDLRILQDTSMSTRDKATALGISIQYTSVLIRRHAPNLSTATGKGRPRKPLPPELDGLLGKMSDSDIARRLGITRLSVAMRRNELEIPAFVQRAASRPSRYRNQ